MFLVSFVLAVALAGAPTGATAKVAAAAHADADDAIFVEDAASQRHAMEFTRRLADSAAPRDWALAAQIWIEGNTDVATQAARHGVLLRKAAEAAPDDRLVQALWAAAPEQGSGCEQRKPCPERAMAFARLEPDNGAAWMPVLEQAWRAKDSRAVDAALARMAVASRYDDLFVEATVAWVDAYRRFPLPVALLRKWKLDLADPSLVASPESASVLLGFARSAAMAAGSMGAMRACDVEQNPGASEARFADCARVGRLMRDAGTTMMGRQLGMAFLRVSGSVTPADEAANRIAAWKVQQFIGQSRSLSDPRTVLAYYADLKATGNELRAQELLLGRAGIAIEPPAGWTRPALPGLPSK